LPSDLSVTPILLPVSAKRPKYLFRPVAPFLKIPLPPLPVYSAPTGPPFPQNQHLRPAHWDLPKLGFLLTFRKPPRRRLISTQREINPCTPPPPPPSQHTFSNLSVGFPVSKRAPFSDICYYVLFRCPPSCACFSLPPRFSELSRVWRPDFWPVIPLQFLALCISRTRPL